MQAPEAEQLVEMYWPLAMSIANRWGRKWPFLHDDFRSAAAWTLWRAATTWDPSKGKFPAYVHAAVRRQCLERLRKERRKAPEAFRSPPEDPDLDPLNLLTDPAPGPGDHLDNVEEVEHLLQSLPDGPRAAIELHFLDGVSTAEIADAKGVSRTSVNQTIARALNRMSIAASK